MEIFSASLRPNKAGAILVRDKRAGNSHQITRLDLQNCLPFSQHVHKHRSILKESEDGEMLRTALMLSLLNSSPRAGDQSQIDASSTGNIALVGNTETVISQLSEARDDAKTRATCPEDYVMVDCRLYETLNSIADGLLLQENSCVAGASDAGKSVQVRIL